MANLEKCLAFVLKHEGTEYTEDKDDRGGATKFGISQAAYPQINLVELTLEMAHQLYKHDYWKFDDVSNDDIAALALDTVVNFGVAGGAKIIQRALKSAGQRVEIDGVIGPKTIEAMNRVEPKRFFRELAARRAFVHAKIALRHPAQVKWLFGWLRRDCDTP